MAASYKKSPGRGRGWCVSFRLLLLSVQKLAVN
jgi:hypothetical protein